MPADQIRNRTVGCKMTDSEYERLSAVVESEGMTLGEWCREVLLERAGGRSQTERHRRDAAGRGAGAADDPAECVLQAGPGGETFKYDPFGRRVEKISPTTTSIFAYDGDNVVETVNSTCGVIARCTQGLNTDEPLAESRSGTVSFYEQDALSSVTSLTNAAGALAQTYTYDSFGNTTNSSGSLTNFFRYAGREFDTETGLYFDRARYLDPSTGRFLSEDPVRFRGGIDFYPYAANLLYSDAPVDRASALDATCWMLLRRYGVVFREVLTRETILPRWRELLIALRRLEDRGEVRGGRFVSGFLGEQFALPIALESLRAMRGVQPGGETITLSSADPLNFVGILVPGERVSASSGKLVAFRDGVALAEGEHPGITPITAAIGSRAFFPRSL